MSILTDVPAGKVRSIVVVQPGSTVGCADPMSVDWGNAFYDVYDWLSVKHVGTLAMSRRGGQPDHFFPCDGKIVMTDPKSSRFYGSSSAFSQRDFLFTCTNPECDMHLVTGQYMRYTEFRPNLLHLMLKQVVPKLPCCNFVDCSSMWSGLVLTEKKIALMKQLGFMAVDLCLWGILDNPDSTPRHATHFGLGYMLMPNMHVQVDGSGAWSQWLQFLVCQKFSALKELCDALPVDLLGQKTIRC